MKMESQDVSVCSRMMSMWVYKRSRKQLLLEIK